MKLHQLIALLPGAKKTAKAVESKINSTIQRQSLFQGLSRVYSPSAEDGYVYPSENQSVSTKGADLVREMQAEMTKIMDLCAAQDIANTSATANIEIDGITLAESIPVTHLLYIEKQLQNMRTFIRSLPTLPIDTEWIYDRNKGCYQSTPKVTVKTKKITDFVVAYDATPEHPAQIKEVSKDIVEGSWQSVSLSGAFPVQATDLALAKVDALIQAVIKARGAANEIEVEVPEVSSRLLEYIFSDLYAEEGTQL